MQTVNLDQATLYTLPLLASLAFAITQADKFEFLSEVRDIFKVGGGASGGAEPVSLQVYRGGISAQKSFCTSMREVSKSYGTPYFLTA